MEASGSQVVSEIAELLEQCTPEEISNILETIECGAPVAQPAAEAPAAAAAPAAASAPAPAPALASETVSPSSSSTAQPAAAGEEEKRSAFAWLKRGQKAKAPSLRELLAAEGPEQALVRAVASQLAVDAPDGCFQGVPGLTAVPESVPKAMRVTLLHAAVTGEADKLKAVERASAVTGAAGAVLAELADRAAGLGEKKERTEALEHLVVLSREASQLCVELAPDVEPEAVTYEGGMRGKRLEDLYSDYVDSTVEDVQAQTMAMLGGLMGGLGGAAGAGAGAGNPEQMQARMDHTEVIRQDLAKFLKIPESKAEKLLQKRTDAMAAQAQKEMMANLGNLGNLGGLTGS